MRYTEWHLKSDGSKTGKRVLTDLKKDPGEETNVVQDSAYADVLAKAEELLADRIERAVLIAPALTK